MLLQLTFSLAANNPKSFLVNHQNSICGEQILGHNVEFCRLCPTPIKKIIVMYRKPLKRMEFPYEIHEDMMIGQTRHNRMTLKNSQLLVTCAHVRIMALRDIFVQPRIEND